MIPAHIIDALMNMEDREAAMLAYVQFQEYDRQLTGVQDELLKANGEAMNAQHQVDHLRETWTSPETAEALRLTNKLLLEKLRCNMNWLKGRNIYIGGRYGSLSIGSTEGFLRGRTWELADIDQLADLTRTPVEFWEKFLYTTIRIIDKEDKVIVEPDDRNYKARHYRWSEFLAPIPEYTPEPDMLDLIKDALLKDQEAGSHGYSHIRIYADGSGSICHDADCSDDNSISAWYNGSRDADYWKRLRAWLKNQKHA